MKRHGVWLVTTKWRCHLQGRPDFALASAGGGIVAHSMLAPEAQPRQYFLTFP